MGEADLEKAVTSAELAGLISGNAIGFKAKKVGSSFVVKSGLYLVDSDEGPVFGAGPVHFDFKVHDEGIDLVVCAGGDEICKEFLEPNDRLAAALENERLTIYYSSCCENGKPRITLAGIKGKDPAVEVVLDGEKFLTREDYSRLADKKILPATGKKPRLGMEKLTEEIEGMIPLARIKEGYIPPEFKKGSNEYSATMQRIRSCLDSKDLPKSRTKIRTGYYFPREELPAIHALLQGKGFKWYPGDSPYAPEKGKNYAQLTEEKKPAAALPAEKAAPPPKPKIGKKQEPKPEPNAPEPKPVDDPSVLAQVDEAVSKGEMKLEQAILYMLPLGYDIKSQRHKEMVASMREALQEYSTRELSGKKIAYSIGSTLMISADRVRDFYREVISHFQNDLQAFISDFGFINEQQPDIRFAPHSIDGLYKSMLRIMEDGKGNVSKGKMFKQLDAKSMNYMKNFKHSYKLREVVQQIYFATKDIGLLEAVTRESALKILRDRGVKDPELALIKNERDITITADSYSSKRVLQLALLTKFRQENPHVFYDFM